MFQKCAKKGHDKMILCLANICKNCHTRCVLFALKYSFGCFFIFHTRVNLRSSKIRKNPSLVDFHSLYQLLNSQVYRNGLKLSISKVKICIDKERESNRKLPKMFTCKKFTTDTKKASGGDLMKKRPDAVC